MSVTFFFVCYIISSIFAYFRINKKPINTFCMLRFRRIVDDDDNEVIMNNWTIMNENDNQQEHEV